MYAKDISRDAIVLMFKTWLYLILMSEITSEKMASINRILGMYYVVTVVI